MRNDIKEVGLGIKRARLGRSLTQDEMAMAMGVTRHYICTIETGLNVPGMVLLKKLSETYGISFTISGGVLSIEEGH